MKKKHNMKTIFDFMDEQIKKLDDLIKPVPQNCIEFRFLKTNGIIYLN